MSTASQPEVWLRGALPGVSPFLQPVAHALLQAQEEISVVMNGFPQHLLWQKPAGMASPGFHLQHIPGVLDRLLSYAKGQPLTEEQFAYLRAEGKAGEEEVNVSHLVNALDQKVTTFTVALKGFDENRLIEAREVGRAKLPSTVMGLLFHAAEHTMRHTGQLLVTTAVLKANMRTPGSASL